MLALFALTWAAGCAVAQEPAASQSMPAAATADPGGLSPMQAPATSLPTAALAQPAATEPATTSAPPATDLPPATSIPVSTQGKVHSVGAEEAEEARSKYEGLLRASWKTDFTRSTISFNEIMTGGPPKDGIPAIDDPEFQTVSEADAWLDPREPVQVVDLNGDARAYPVQVMVWHEIVNDTVGGEPVVITF